MLTILENLVCTSAITIFYLQNSTSYFTLYFLLLIEDKCNDWVHGNLSMLDQIALIIDMNKIEINIFMWLNNSKDKAIITSEKL